MARGKKGVKDIHETMPSSVDVLSQASKAKTCEDTRRLEDVYVYIYIYLCRTLSRIFMISVLCHFNERFVLLVSSALPT